MELYCNNCGNRDHKYKDCPYPILSYGILLFNLRDELLMIERKDCLTYVEFFRGKYSLNNIDYIILLFNRMSKMEIEKILKNNFDDLWDDLWVDKNTLNQKIKNEYYSSKSKFNKLRVGYILNEVRVDIKYIINNMDSKYEDNEWEIPKGRRNYNESDLECAKREFYEETNIMSDKYNILNIEPIIDEYKGINNVKYRHIYFIGRINYDIKLDVKTTMQKKEIRDIGWFSNLDSINNIRDYNKNKKNLIKTGFEIFKK